MERANLHRIVRDQNSGDPIGGTRGQLMQCTRTQAIGIALAMACMFENGARQGFARNTIWLIARAISKGQSAKRIFQRRLHRANIGLIENMLR